MLVFAISLGQVDPPLSSSFMRLIPVVQNAHLLTGTFEPFMLQRTSQSCPPVVFHFEFAYISHLSSPVALLPFSLISPTKYEAAPAPPGPLSQPVFAKFAVRSGSSEADDTAEMTWAELSSGGKMAAGDDGLGVALASGVWEVVHPNISEKYKKVMNTPVCYALLYG